MDCEHRSLPHSKLFCKHSTIYSTPPIGLLCKHSTTKLFYKDSTINCCSRPSMLMKMAVVIMSGSSLMNTRMRSGKTVCDMPLRDDRSIFVHR